MDSGHLNVGVVDELSAEAFGEPGKRTFRLRARTRSGEVGLWLEKEQVVALGNAVQQILERVPQSQGVKPRPVKSSAQVSGEVAARVGALSLAFDTTQNAFAIKVTDLWEATLDVQSMMLLATRSQLASLEEQVQEIVAGSRPRCPMCGSPLTQAAHFCPPSNGHAHIAD